MMADNAVLATKSTSTPLELDQIYQSIDDLTVALGPDGANDQGALSRLLDSTAKNFEGQGTQFHRTVENVSKLTGTLDDNKEELFGTARQVERFVNALATNDGTVRQFNDSLASAATCSRTSAQDLAAALRNLGIAMKARSTASSGTTAGALARTSRGSTTCRRSWSSSGPRSTRCCRSPRRRWQPVPHLQPAERDPGHPRPTSARTSTITGDPANVRLRLLAPPTRADLGPAPEALPDAPEACRSAAPSGSRGQRTGERSRPSTGPSAASWRCTMKRPTSRADRATWRRVTARCWPVVGRCPVRLRLLVYEPAAARRRRPRRPPVHGHTSSSATCSTWCRSPSVKVDDVTVGRVDEIRLDGYHAEVTAASCRDSVKLPDNAVAEIRQTSLLGEKFVSLSAPADAAPHRPARRRRRHPARAHRPQPGGRGGPRRAVACCSTAAAWPSSRPSPTS